MKDLLKVSDDLVIVGLHDRVFVCPIPETSTDKAQLVVELVPTPFQPKNNNTKSSLSTQKRPQPDGAPPVDSNPVQAVALYQQQSSINSNNNKDLVVWCAVARADKSLAVYRMDRSASTVADEEVSVTPMRQIPVVATHRTSKRASALCFSTVPAAVPESSSSSSSEPPLLVVIAADLAGDAVAFSTQHDSSNSQHDGDNANEDPDPLMLGGTTIPHRRLLLGHTASMLTSLAIVEQPERQSLILTADRDEKIRVSSFPNTHSIQGYMLGHTAFVSCIDTVTRVVADQQGNQTQSCWCVSLGGDNTLRMWDCHTCQQLAMVSITHNNDNSSNNNQQHSKSQVNGDAHDNNNDEKKTDESDHLCTKRNPVPSKVTLNARGNRIATICDESQKIYLWQVVLAKEDGQEKVKIIALRNVLCPSQPLAISFYDNDHLLVLLREPEYLKVYNIASAAHEVSDTTKTLESSLCTQLGQVAASIRAMPTSVLERDAYGNLIMAKVNEQRSSGVPKTQPWNNAQRIDTAKERQKRWRKRKAAQEDSGEEEEEEDEKAS